MTANRFDHLVPEYIRSAPAYVPGKPVEEAAREFGLDPASIVKLASNENPLGISNRVKAAISAAVDHAERYPDAHGYALRQKLVEMLGVEPAQILLGNGSSDLIAMVAQTFLTAKSSVVLSQHAFSAYVSASRAQGAELITAPARDFGHDPDAMLAAIRPDTRLMFIANPNNPTGTYLAPDVLRDFIARVPGDVIVMLDEAYREYQPAADVPASLDWIADHPNLIVSRTLSKGYALGGLRIGYAVGSRDVIDLTNRVRQTFNTNLIAQAAAVAALDDKEHLARTHAMNAAGLRQLDKGLAALGLDRVPSAANFIMVAVPDGPTIYRALLRKGVIVRPLGPNYGLSGYLRVSVGTEAENARFLEAMGDVLAILATAPAAAE